MTLGYRQRMGLRRVAREEPTQVAVAQLLDAAKVLWCHVPNGGARNVITGAKLKRQGVKPGVPDVLIFDPPPKRVTFCGAAMEIKDGKGRATPEQKEWLANLAACGWVTRIVYGIDDALIFLKECGYVR